MRIAHLFSAAALFGLATLVACAGTADKKSGGLTVSFPSTNAALNADTLELHVLDGSDPSSCLNAVRARKAAPGAPPSGSLFDIPATDTCKFLSNGVKPFDLGYGARAFLVVAQKGGSDFMLGCTIAGIGDVQNDVNVELTTIDKATDVAQSTKCSSLSQKCGGTACF